MGIRKVLAAVLFAAVLALRPVGLPDALAQSAILIRGPYLQNVTPTSVLVVWETDQPTDSKVKYGLTTEYGLATSNTSLTIRHVVTLNGLSQYTIYHYRVGTSSGDLSEDSTLKTAASWNQTSFEFVVLGDTHAGEIAHQSVVDGIISISPDFYLHTGDLVTYGAQLDQWNSFFQIESGLMRTTTLFPTMGNHEENHQNYFDFFYLPHNERWYSFDYGHVHFICLEIDWNAAYNLWSEQYLWLEQDLARSAQPWKFVFFHIPPYSSGEKGSDLAVRAALQALFEKYRVDMVFNGHDHDYEHSVINGVTYIVSGGGGAPPSKRQQWNDWTVCFESTNHFVQITIDGNTLTSVGIRPDGSRFDAFTIEKQANILGDANGDGRVNALDITKVERITGRLDAAVPGADANQDGSINAIDIPKVERIIAGLD